jgi:hypothetical protein
MLEIALMSIAIALLGAAKKGKMPVFGQMTLTGEKAVDWVKPDAKITARKIWMGAGALMQDFNLPDWAKDKGVCALIFPQDEWGNPMLVTQKSILRILEAKCCEFESAGAIVNILKVMKGQIAEIIFEENEPTFEFIKPKDAKQYDPYKVVIE